jgi:endonuclease/exonuclease/phosphatase family metal-dependent hydrolase
MSKQPSIIPLTLSALTLAIAAAFAAPVLASSSVYVTNNTPKVLKLNTTSELSDEYWNRKATTIPAFTRKRILETNRDTGVTDGETFIFTAEVLPQNPDGSGTIPQFEMPFAIRLKLEGKTIGSHMWQSVRTQTGQQLNWHDDRQKYSETMRILGRPWTVTYWAYYTGGDDDVEYVFREDYPLPQGFGQSMTHDWKIAHLNVLTYNVYMRPTSLFHNGQAIRAGLIPAQIPGYDVVVFQEAFDDDTRATLLSGMTAQGYPHHSSILGSDRGTEQDGGVIIASRWPIVLEKEKLFNDTCSGSDCMADKGVIYARIDKQVKAGEHHYFHVFGTHLNDGDEPVQKQQLQIIRNFIDAQNIPDTEGVIVAGDFNINRDNAAMYQYALDKLGVGWFSGAALRGHPYTFDGPLNDLGDGSQSNYDYVFYSTRHLALTPASYAEVRVPRALSEWKEYETESAMWDLSDHYAVYANLHFAYDPLAGWDPGVDPNAQDVDYQCNQDSDCPEGLICLEGAPPRPGAKLVPPGGAAKVARPSAGMTQVAPVDTVKIPGRPVATPSGSKPVASRVETPAATAAAPTTTKPPKIRTYKGLCRVEPPR